MTQVLPAQLTQTQKRALRLIHDRRMYRRLNGYGQAPAGVSLDVVSTLRGLGLVRIDISGRQPCPVLTGAGHNLHNVMTVRAEQRRQA